MGIGPVRHNVSGNRFELTIGGEMAVADYTLQDGRMVITHTWTPPVLRGHGVATALITSALETARAQGLKVVPQCSYVEVFLRRHPEYEDLRA